MAEGKQPTIFFSVGEPSGDVHGANLIRALAARCPEIKTVGYGGPNMAAAGCHLHADLTKLAVMWFARAIAHLPEFLALLRRAECYFRDQRPDAVVLVDYPGFNWWIARRAKEQGIPVFYYTPPQIWAWGTWRARKMRRWVDHVLCSLPFEEPWFRAHGCNATFVGHPFFDEVTRQPLDEPFLVAQQSRGGPLVTILPGSRTQEVTHNFRWFLKAARRIRAAVPEVRFAVAAFKPHQAELAQKMVTAEFSVCGTGSASGAFPIEVHCGKTAELMALADCCMSTSGSVSLELLYYTKPTVILYWISRTAYLVQSFFRRVKYITLVNLLATDTLYPSDLSLYDAAAAGAEKVPFPEYLTYEDRSAAIAGHVTEWLTQPARRAERIAELAALKARVASGGASRRAAAYILERL
jgi:lipid-A-disaccharide synthase